MKLIKKIILRILKIFDYQISKIQNDETHIQEYNNFLFKQNKLDKNFKQSLEIFFKLKEKWKKKLIYPFNEIEIIPAKVFMGAFGNYIGLLTLLMANKYKLRKQKKLVCYVPEHLKFNNDCLKNYFQNFVKIYRKEIFSKTFIKQHEIDTGSITEFDNFALPLHESKNFIEQKKKNDKPFLKLKSTHINEGNSILKKMGIKKNEKFVTLHIRQFGWRGETKQNTNENFRTPSVSNYIDTIKYLTKKKIKVILVGNNNYKFEKIKNFINYSNSKFKSDSMDIFLAAKSLFCIANPSGYYVASLCFGTPVLLTDAAQYSNYFVLTKKDMFLPRPLKKSGKSIPLLDCFKSPINHIFSDKHLQTLSIKALENSPTEIKESAKEMLKKTYSKKETNLQKLFKKKFDNKFRITNNYNFGLKANAGIPNYFLAKNL